ncbi:alanine--tRNA ligase-related protein [Pseudofrankia sp. BMG5.37]|uniref:alanine--tRNA ligase-related protein n=1 Tax=Pseudofrankia sp. BMG5.37 TaxID=3050035 RepID=UPI002894EF15|nr:alanine--tRNA ligase-related protein [Pseudofrankia sp. BMG5.37]MDT3438272.1 alanine--tRNA ligase-related protein [Pseudofrankia sp. BMG5.37]
MHTSGSTGGSDLDKQLLYLDNQFQLQANCLILGYAEDDGRQFLVLDRTPYYPKRGGQPSDTGKLEGEGFIFDIESVVIKDAQVLHFGRLEGRLPNVGETVKAVVDRRVRELHSRWHSAGEAVIVAAKMAGFDEEIIAAIHYGPNQNRIEYRKRLTTDEAANLQLAIQENLDTIGRDDTSVEILNLSRVEDVERNCGFIPDYIPSGASVRVVKIRPDFTGRPCTGTHLAKTSSLGTVAIEKVRNKGDRLIISYDCR